MILIFFGSDSFLFSGSDFQDLELSSALGHGDPNPDSLSTMRVRIRVPMSVFIFKTSLTRISAFCMMFGCVDNEYR